MREILEREFIYLWYYFSVQFQQIFKYWLIGMLLGSAISVFGKDKIHKLFVSLRAKKLGVFALVPASLLGIASPLCMYGTIPIAASFSEQGMDDDILSAFMMSSILLNPQLLFYSAALGMPMLIIRLVSCFLCGITAGLLVRYIFRRKKFFNFFTTNQTNQTNSPSDIEAKVRGGCEPKVRCGSWLIEFLKSLARNIKATGIYFLIGITLSAIFQRYVPAESFARIFGGNRGFGLLMAATIGVPLYMCGGGTIPLLQTWLNNGMSMGSATAFMITGPATKITNLGALKIVLGIKHFIFYLLFAILFALLSGFLINLFS